MEIGNVDIAALSMQMVAQKTQSEVSVAVFKKTMDAQTEIAELLINDLMASAPTSRQIDISV